VDGTRDRGTYQKLVTRSRYGLVPCAVGIWSSHQRDDSVMAGASVDVQRGPDPARKLSANLYDIYHCCVYSKKLLMMDRGTVLNMQSFIPKINFRN